MALSSEIRDLADNLRKRFADKGAQSYQSEILMTAGGLLDLYGEDIRARAYVTQDPIRGEMMLRPDFTLQLTSDHLARDAGQASYVYSGEVFRRQEVDDDRSREVLQVGYERFSDPDPAEAEADVFCEIWNACKGADVSAVTGDIGFLNAAVDELDTPERRKTALRRHLRHPVRFRALLDRFSRPAPPPPSPSTSATHVGLRSAAEIESRLAVLQAEHETPAIDPLQVKKVFQILDVRGRLPSALIELRNLAGHDSGLVTACDCMEARLEAIASKGVTVDALDFEASYGRTSMEYYDGFVFGLNGGASEDPPLATGGRYDALCTALGGKGVTAVGGVIRPAILLGAQS